MGCKMGQLIYGVGVNDADYVTGKWETVGYVNGKQKQKLTWYCPFYRTWTSMLARGYSARVKTKYPTYKGVYSCDEWHLFSTFKAWMEDQDWEGKQLDKDILFVGNKIYSPETCVFVSGVVNSFMTEHGAGRGQYMIGVCWHKPTSKFMAQCRNPFTMKNEYLGLFNSESSAHKAWLERKLEHAYALAAIQTDERIAKALVETYKEYENELP